MREMLQYKISLCKRFWLRTGCERHFAPSDHGILVKETVILHPQLVASVGRVWCKLHFKLIRVLCVCTGVSVYARARAQPHLASAQTQAFTQPRPAGVQSTVNTMVGVGAAASDGPTNHDRVKNNGRYINPDADLPEALLTQTLESQCPSISTR